MRRLHAVRSILLAPIGGALIMVVASVLSAPAAGTPAAAATTRTFSGQFSGFGTFRDALCTYRTTYSGTVTLTLIFDSTNVTGTAQHRGGYQDSLVNSPPECGGDNAQFDETVTVSGTANSIRWGFPHGASGRVAVTASLIGSSIVGQGVVTDPGFTGSATVPFTLNETTPPAAQGSAGGSASTGGGPSGGDANRGAPAAPAEASPTTTSTQVTPPATANQTGSAGPVGAAPVIPPIGAPPIPAPRDGAADANRALTAPTREACMNVSSDPAFWQTVGDLDEGGYEIPSPDELAKQGFPPAPMSAVRGCVALYRAAPWPHVPGGVELSTGGAGGDQTTGNKPEQGAPIKATLQTTGQLFHTGDPNQTTKGGVAVKAGTTLTRGDTLVTKGDNAVVAFSDGSKVEVSPNSAVIMGDPAQKSLVQLRGRLFMDIKSRNWTVRVPNIKGVVSVAVRGTKFSTEVAEDGAVRVEVTESAVEVTSAGKTVAVPAGSSIVVRPGEAPPAVIAGPSAAGDQSIASQSTDTPTALIYGAVAVIAGALSAGALLLRRRRTR